MLTQRSPAWGIILAGGDGTRLQQFIKRLYGIVRPKQYCSIVGRRTMLQHTRDRLELLYPRERILTVVNRSHLDYVHAQLRDQPDSTILVQPCGRETANGILFALLHINNREPDAIVSIFPADHFIREEARFMRHVDIASREVRKADDLIVLLGASPGDSEQEYGWIERDNPVRNPWKVSMHHIGRFWEKPDRNTAEMLFHRQCLWSTLIMVGKVKKFLALFQKLLPDIFQKMSKIMQFRNMEEREKLLSTAYPALPSRNFSTEILEKSVNHFCVLELSDIYWSDWGDERRILRDVASLHLQLHAENTQGEILHQLGWFPPNPGRI